MGGTILTRAKVTRLTERNGRIESIEYNDGERVSGACVISNLHPALTLSLIEESKLLRRIYRSRINNLPNTYGMFTVHLELKENSVPYLNKNLFIHKGGNLWDCSYRASSVPTVSSLLVSYQVPDPPGGYAVNIDLLTPMHWEEVSRWSDTAPMRRGEEYETFKTRKAEACIVLATGRIPELKGNIVRFHTSTPLTYRDYTGTLMGSAYGIQKNCNDVLKTLLTPQTPIPNLFLTGQNLNLHGVFGVSMTAFFTCARITGMESLVKDLEIIIPE
jgi:all-trans-retinol 13,14-reductase